MHERGLGTLPSSPSYLTLRRARKCVVLCGEGEGELPFLFVTYVILLINIRHTPTYILGSPVGIRNNTERDRE
jgi:hypothetical protein